MIEVQLDTSTVSGGAPYFIHHIEKALDVQVSSSISMMILPTLVNLSQVLHCQSGLGVR